MWPDWLGGALYQQPQAGTPYGGQGAPNAYPSSLLGLLPPQQAANRFNPGLGLAGLGLMQGRGIGPSLFQNLQQRNYCPPQPPQPTTTTGIY